MNIPVLRLHYVPKGTEFTGILLKGQKAIMTFETEEGGVIQLTQISGTVDELNVHFSDRTEYDSFYSRRWNETVSLRKNELQNNKTEYSADIMTKTAYYCVSGILEEEEFEQIVDKMYFD